MEIVVTGRNVEVPEHFRIHVAEKVARLERYDHKIVGLEVELFHEPNRRQSKSCQRVEITGRGCGSSVARAEACGPDFYSALDTAVSKLDGRLRRSHDRRRVNGRRTRAAAASRGGVAVLEELETETLETEALLRELPADPDLSIPTQRTVPDDAVDHYAADHDTADHYDTDRYAPEDDDLPGQIVRSKVHTAEPMTVDDALSHMELVGHDFYLFADKESGEPSVVYRRKGYAYGVIRLSS